MALSHRERGLLGGRPKTTCEHPNPRRYKSGSCKECGDARAAKIKAAKKQWVDELKLAQGCAICGYKASARALGFHHVSGEKLFSVSQGLGRSREAILAEIEKCTVLCANCHLALHEEEVA